MPIIENFAVPAGDDVELDFVVQSDEDVSLFGAIVKWRLYEQRLGIPFGQALIDKTTESGGGITITNNDERLFSVMVAGSETEALLGRYYHEAEVTSVDGAHATVTTGIVTISRTIIPNLESG